MVYENTHISYLGVKVSHSVIHPYTSIRSIKWTKRERKEIIDFLVWIGSKNTTLDASVTVWVWGTYTKGKQQRIPIDST